MSDSEEKPPTTEEILENENNLSSEKRNPGVYARRAARKQNYTTNGPDVDGNTPKNQLDSEYKQKKTIKTNRNYMDISRSSLEESETDLERSNININLIANSPQKQGKQGNGAFDTGKTLDSDIKMTNKSILNEETKERPMTQTGIQAQMSEKSVSDSKSPENFLRNPKSKISRLSAEESALEIQELSKEQEILQESLANEKIFIESLSPEQLSLFKIYMESLESIKLLQKLKNVRINSKHTQHKIMENSYTPKKYSKESSSSPVRIKRTRLDGDSILSGRMIIHRSTVSENFSIEYQGLIDKPKLNLPPMVVTIFNGEQEINSLSTQLKFELVKSLEGHDEKQCEIECIHLKRALEIKRKSRGVPYPLKTKIIDSLS